MEKEKGNKKKNGKEGKGMGPYGLLGLDDPLLPAPLAEWLWF